MVYKEYLRYLDLFGTKCSFYSDQRLKFYTPLGGIISTISVCTCILIFVFSSLSSFRREYPSLVTRSIIDEEQKINFNQEKIYIPWKLQKNKNNFNNTNLLFPIIKYNYKDNKSDIMKYKILSYRHCNETSMANSQDKIKIDTPLDQLYCIDMDDLIMGGSWLTDYLYYIEFNLYLCKNDTLCLPYNNLEIIFYYPTIRFHEDNYKTPLEIKYDKDNVILNNKTTKINQIYFRKIILNDKNGFFDSRVKNYKYWECSRLNKDFYTLDKTEQKLFSLEIFVEQNTVHYFRTYKNIIIILEECLPLMSLIHTLLKLIAKIFKLSSINRKMTELLFENLTEKPNNFQNYIRDIKTKKYFSKYNTNKNRGLNNNSINNNINNSNNIHSNTNENNVKSTEENNIISLTNKDNKRNINNYSNVTLINKFYVSKNNNSICEPIINSSQNPINRNSVNFNDRRLLDLKINSLNLNNLVKKNDKKSDKKSDKKNDKKNKKNPFKKKKKYVSNKLFPYRYYLCTIFSKNMDLAKYPFCMSKKYIKVYYFLCQLFDISSYCILQKEFNIAKNFIFDEKNLQLIEQNSKINVNDQFFMRDLNDCIIKNKFHILGINNIKKKYESSNDVIGKM